MAIRGALRTADCKCPDLRWWKPVKPEALITTGRLVAARTRVVAAHFQASKALRLRDVLLNYVLRYGIVT